MMRRLSVQSLILAPFCPDPAAGFLSIRAPAVGAGLAPVIAGKFKQPPEEGVTRCSVERCAQNDRPRRRRRQHSSPVLREASDAAGAAGAAAAEAAAEVEEVAYAPGCECSPHEPAVRAFEAWAALAGCGGSSASLSHADFDGLRGIMTKASLKPWQPIATVPTSVFLEEELLLLDTAAASSSAATAAPPLPPPAPLSAEAWRRCPWWVRLGVRLLNESVAGESSRLKEYVRMLPAPGETGTPVNWSAEQLERLHYPRLLSQVKLQRRLFEGFRKFLLADATRGETAGGAREGGRSPYPLVDALGDAATFSWALECVLSRAFQLPPEDAGAVVFGEGDDVPVKAPELTPPAPEATRMALLPLIDSVNHYSRIPTHMFWDEDGALSLAVGASFDAGDHAFVSYGPVSNDDLLQYYGFVERDNPSDAYVLEDMGKWLREDELINADLSSRLINCPGAREAWRYLRRGVILRDAVHPATMQAVRILSCEPQGGGENGHVGAAESKLRWDGTEADLNRFATPVSLASEMFALELLMRYSAREADAWGEAGVAGALAEDPTAPGLDGDLDGLGLDTDRRLMLSVFRQEKIALLRGIVGRLTHMRKVSGLLNRPIKMPVNSSPPPTLGPVGYAGGMSHPSLRESG